MMTNSINGVNLMVILVGETHIVTKQKDDKKAIECVFVSIDYGSKNTIVHFLMSLMRDIMED